MEWDVTTERGVVDCYRATIDEVFGYAVRLTGEDRSAEDLVQDVYLSLVRHARDGKVDRIGLGWLMTSTKNRFLNTLEAGNRERRRRQLVAPVVDDGEPSPDESATLLAPLSERERRAIVLRYVLDLPLDDVADRLGLSRRATESLLVRARARAVQHGHDEGVRDA